MSGTLQLDWGLSRLAHTKLLL